MCCRGQRFSTVARGGSGRCSTAAEVQCCGAEVQQSPRAALVKVKGTVVGYLSSHLGVIEVADQEGRRRSVLFHTDDVWVFRKPLAQYDAQPGLSGYC